MTAHVFSSNLKDISTSERASGDGDVVGNGNVTGNYSSVRPLDGAEISVPSSGGEKGVGAKSPVRRSSR